MWCWKSFSATMQKMRKPRFERKEVMTDAGPISVLVTPDAISQRDIDDLQKMFKPEAPADPSRRSFFGVAVGGAVAAPEIVKTAADKSIGFRLASSRPILPPFRPLVYGVDMGPEVIMPIHRNISAMLQARFRRLNAQQNTPMIKAKSMILPGLPERISRERCHKKVKADA